MIVIGKRCYHIVVAGRDVAGDKPSVRQCLDSFEIIE
jgi:hypothetical protein